MRTHFLIHPICIAAALALAAPAALSQAATLDLKAAVEAAWQRSPLARTLEAKQDESAAGSEAAQSWLAGAPSLGLSQRGDQWNNGKGVRETDISLSAPIWLPAQKAARQAQALGNADELAAQIANARLTVAGMVRESLWAVASAREDLGEARSHQHHLEAGVDEVMRRVTAGELARLDAMLAQQEALAGAARVNAAQAKLAEALARYTTLTGLPDIPPAEPESIAAGMLEPHPRLRAASAAVQHARASLDVVNRTRNEAPTVGIAMRREKDGTTAGPASSIAFAVAIPFGTDARARPRETAARTQVATAMAEAAQTDASVHAQIALARSHLAASSQAQETAAARGAVARDYAQLIEKAFRLGERGLADLLRARAVLHEAAVGQRQQRIDLGLAHARLNQALGILP